MINFLRKFIIISVLFALIYISSSFSFASASLMNPSILITFGFAVLAAFTLGELFGLIKLPRLSGYILTGLFFGTSVFIFDSHWLNIIDVSIIENLSIITGFILNIIFLSAGLKVDFKRFNGAAKSISLFLAFKLLATILLVAAAFTAVMYFINVPAAIPFNAVLFAGIIFSVAAFSSSSEIAFGIANETGLKDDRSLFIYNATLVNEFFVAALIPFLFLMGGYGVGFTSNIFAGFISLVLSALLGLALGIGAFFYAKYVNKEFTLFIMGIALAGGLISYYLGLYDFIVFLSAGIYIGYFSKSSEEFKSTINTALLPLLVIYFVFTAASLNVNLSAIAWIAGALLAAIRILGYYLSFKSAQFFSKDLKQLRLPWLGFLSTGESAIAVGSLLTLAPVIGELALPVFSSFFLINFFIGPIFLKFIGASQTVAKAEETAPAIKEKPVYVKKPGKFNEPNFEDETLNRSVYNILFRLNNIVQNFEKRIIYQRSEESVELIVSATEKYSEEYLKLKKAVTSTAIHQSQIKREILNSQKSLAEWLNALIEERKKVEQKIIDLEPLVQDLYISISDLVEGLAPIYTVEMEPDKLHINKDDSWYAKFRKSGYLIDLSVHRLFNKSYKPVRKIHYKLFAKYYLIGKSSGEILETINLVGAERLLTLKRVNSLFEDLNKYFDELFALALDETDSIALQTVIFEKLDEIHQQFVNEINIYTEEINRTSDEIRERMRYALATPFNAFIETLHSAGTYELSESRFKFSKVFAESEERKELAQQSLRYWVNYYLGYLGSSQKDAVLKKLKSEILISVDAEILAVSEYIGFEIKRTSAELKKAIADFKRNGLQPDLEAARLEEILADNLRILSEDILKSRILALEEIRTGKKLGTLVNNSIAQFQSISDGVPESIFLLNESELTLKNRIPKFVELKNLPARKIVNPLIVQKLPRELSEINEVLLNHLIFSIDEIKNINSIVTYHINSAIKELRGNETAGKLGAADLITQLTDKISSRINRLTAQSERIEANLSHKIYERVNSVLAFAQEVLNFSAAHSAGASVEKAKTYIPIITEAAWIGSKTAELFRKFRFIIQKSYITPAISLLQRFYRYMTGEPKSKGGKDFIYDSELDEEKLKNLPFIYRKLFDGSPVEATDFFIGREQIFSNVEQAFKSFLQGKPSASVLIGDSGSGKRSMLNTICSQYFLNYNYARYHFENTATSAEELFEILSRLIGAPRTLNFEELRINLNDKSKKKIIVLEGIHKLFLKEISGYEALNALSLLISVTNNNAFWVCSINKHAWNFLSANFGLNNLFRYKIVAEDLSQKDIRSIIMNRHNATGFELVFLTENGYKHSKKKKDAGKDKAADEFFERLNEFSEGNILTAMFYWLKSINSVQGNVIKMNPCKRINLSALDEIGIVSALTLGNIIQHGWITDEEHSEIFNMPLEQSREILTNLANMNLIYQDRLAIDSNKYFLNKYLYKPIEKELLKRNIL
jgi:Kef-type K+ transport system membrane component KefB